MTKLNLIFARPKPTMGNSTVPEVAASVFLLKFAPFLRGSGEKIGGKADRREGLRELPEDPSDLDICGGPIQSPVK
jgi:hypothetical protein